MEENQSPQPTPDTTPQTAFPPEPTSTPFNNNPPVSTPAPEPFAPSEPAVPTVPVVPVLPAPQPMAMDTPPVPTKKKPNRLIVGGIIAAAIVLLGGGGALAYTQWYQNPDKVVHDAIIKAVQAKSLSLTGDVAYKTEGLDLKLALDSKSTASNGEVNVKATIAVDTENFNHTFNADGTTRIIGDTVYVKLSGIQKIIDDMAKDSDDPVPSYVGDIVKKIDDKWISIKASDYEDTSKEVSEQQKCFTDLAKKVQSDKAMMDEVTKLYKEHQVIIVKNQLGSKTIGGVGSLGYEIEADKDATIAFVKGLNGTALGKEMKSCNKDVNFDDIAKQMTDEDNGDSKSQGKLELWVSRFGHEITEVSLNGKDDDATLNIALQPLFNKDISVEVPKGATPLKTLMEDIQNASMEYYMGSTTQAETMDDSLFGAV